MSRTLIALLILTNAGTGYSYYQYREAYRAAVSTETTSQERETFGAGCVDWINEKADEREVIFSLGRSWKKHGQMVFEMIVAPDQEWEVVREKLHPDELPSFLCTLDRQSGVMFVVTGEERERWMFYE